MIRFAKNLSSFGRGHRQKRVFNPKIRPCGCKTFFMLSSTECIYIFIIYKVMKYRKILMKYNVYFIFSLVKI